jgi:hypothetical protein
MAQSRTAPSKKGASLETKCKRTARGAAAKIRSNEHRSNEHHAGEHHIHSALFASPCCCQCGRQLPGVPFALDNIVCRDCYGMERYVAPSVQGSLPERSIESTVTDESAHADEAVIAE